MNYRKLRLLAGTAAATLPFALAAPASAFDEVHWEWNKVIDEYIDKDITIDVTFTPDGMLELQDLQVFIGDVDADSIVHDITNNAPTTNGGEPQTVTLSGRVSDQTPINDPGVAGAAGNDPDGDGGFAVDAISDNADVEDVGYVNVGGSDQNEWSLELTIETAELGEPLDAETELPEVVSAATAVANNANITSDVMVEMHETQIAFGGFDGDGGENGGVDGSAGSAIAAVFDNYYNPGASTDNPAEDGTNTNDYTGNIGTSSAIALMVAGAAGIIEPGRVEANSIVWDIENATVDSVATAVANNKSVNLEYADGNGVFIGDVTQFAYMDVYSNSFVSDVEISNYSGLGNLDRPIVSSVATSIGNNLSVNVSGVNGGE